MTSVFLEVTVERVRNFFPDDTSTKQTGWVFGWVSVFTDLKRWVGLSLSRFETGIGFANNVNTALAADYLAVRMPFLQGFNGCNNFHVGNGKKRRKKPSKTGLVNGKLRLYLAPRKQRNPRYCLIKGRIFRCLSVQLELRPLIEEKFPPE